MKKEKKEEKEELVIPLSIRMEETKLEIINSINTIIKEKQVDNYFLLKLVIEDIYNEVLSMQRKEIELYEEKKIKKEQEVQKNE